MDTRVERRKQGEGNKDQDGLLSAPQLSTLNKMEGFGWALAFIRRPLFQDVVPVLRHPDCNRWATLESDGAFNGQPDIEIRQ